MGQARYPVICHECWMESSQSTQIPYNNLSMWLFTGDTNAAVVGRKPSVTSRIINAARANLNHTQIDGCLLDAEVRIELLKDGFHVSPRYPKSSGDSV